MFINQIVLQTYIFVHIYILHIKDYLIMEIIIKLIKTASIY